MPKELGNHPKIHHSTRLGDLKIRCGAKDLGAAAKVGEKGVALKVGEKTASHAPSKDYSFKYSFKLPHKTIPRFCPYLYF